MTQLLQNIDFVDISQAKYYLSLPSILANTGIINCSPLTVQFSHTIGSSVKHNNETDLYMPYKADITRNCFKKPAQLKITW